MTPVLLISFPGLVWLADGNTGYKSAFALGWSFGFGFFVAGLYWIAAALFVDISQFWWLVPFAVVGFPAVLAIFTGAALAASYGLCRWLRLGGTERVLALVFCWCVAEWLRGHVLTGFPWNLIGYAWSGAFPGALAMLQFASLFGIYGLSLLTVLIACLPARLGDFSGRRWLSLSVAVLLIALPAGWGAYRLSRGHPGDVPGVTLRLVQPSIPQSFKNDPAQSTRQFPAPLRAEHIVQYAAADSDHLARRRSAAVSRSRWRCTPGDRASGCAQWLRHHRHDPHRPAAR